MWWEGGGVKCHVVGGRLCEMSCGSFGVPV